MGLPPRSLTAEANSCFMVRVPHGPNRIQGCGASIAPECGLPSDQLYRTSNNEGYRVAVTLDTKVLIQGCVKTKRKWAFASFRHRSAPDWRLSFRLHLCFMRPLFNRVPVSAKCKTDKSEQHQDGPGYHQPMWVLHRGEHVVHFNPWLE